MRASLETGYLSAEMLIFSAVKSPSVENVRHCRLLGLGWGGGFDFAPSVTRRARWDTPQVCWKAFYSSILGKAHRKHLERRKEPVGTILEGDLMELLSPAFKEGRSDLVTAE